MDTKDFGGLSFDNGLFCKKVGESEIINFEINTIIYFFIFLLTPQTINIYPLDIIKRVEYFLYIKMNVTNIKK
jgi:hypothetical protein